MSGWKTIDSAPIDGTVVDVFNPYYKRMINARFDYHYWANGKPTKSKTWGNYEEGDIRPTHWMPSPELPEC